MRQIRPPEALQIEPGARTVFLAGSIEMGAAVDWQAEVVNALCDLDVVVLNPRRERWDSSWPQSIDFGPFREQVEWELQAQEMASLILFYFAPETRSPVTLLELGLAVKRKAIVCCPEGYFRKGNVDVVCRRYGIPQVDALDLLIQEARREMSALGA